MKKMKYLMACSAAIAAGIACADGETTPANGVTPFDNLETIKVAEFSATASGTTNAMRTGGEVDGEFIVIDGELGAATPAILVTQNSAQVKDIEKFDITFKAGFVDDDELKSKQYSSAKVGFSLTGGQSAMYYNSAATQQPYWFPFDTLTTEIHEDAEVTLHVDYDGRENKARFKLGSETLTVDDAEWVPVGEVAANNIAAYGAGSIKSLGGTTFAISSEIVPIKPTGEKGKVQLKFNPAQMNALKDAGVDPADPSALNDASAPNGQTKLTNFILFGRANDEVADMPKVVGVPNASEVGKVAVSVSGLEIQHVTGTQIKYVLMGSETGADGTWETVCESTPYLQNIEPSSKILEFRSDGRFRYFKVQVVIMYTTPLNDSTPANNN